MKNNRFIRIPLRKNGVQRYRKKGGPASVERLGLSSYAN
jgi:hypothetical protein